MKRFAFLAVGLSFSLVLVLGCSDSKDGDKDSKSKRLKSKPLSKAVCERGPFTSVLEGTWVLNLESEDGRVQVQRSLRFASNELWLESRCELDAEVVAVSVRSQIQVLSGDFIISDNVSSSLKLSDGFSCDADLRSTTLKYAFEGSCLRLTDPTWTYTELFAPGPRSRFSMPRAWASRTRLGD